MRKNGKIFGMTVYHGSEFVVEKPLHGLGKRTNDYGLGFYCTEDKTLAGAESASRSSFLEARERRDSEARQEFQRLKEPPFDPSGLYMLNILQERIAPDDPRIQ